RRGAYPVTRRRRPGRTSRAGWLLLVCLLAGALAACGGVRAITDRSPSPVAPDGELTVFAAASLTDAFTAIGATFEQAHPGTRVAFNFAGSQTLRTQLAQGARADLFAAADEPTMQGAQADG